MLTTLPTNSRRRKRRKITPPPTGAPIYIIDAAPALNTLALAFDQPVTLNGLPGITTSVAGAVPVSAEQTEPQTIEITFSASVAAATGVSIPFQDPAIRNGSGGYVTGRVFPIAA